MSILASCRSALRTFRAPPAPACAWPPPWTRPRRGLSSESKDELRVRYLDGPDSGIVVVGINRPKAKNAISRNLVKLMFEALQDVRKDNQVRSVIFCSLVPGIFCAGADLKERAKMQPSEVAPFVSKARALISEIGNLPMPTIAAIDGSALGGGLEMALSCDIRIASDSAQMGLVGPSASPGSSTPRWPRSSSSRPEWWTGARRPVWGWSVTPWSRTLAETLPTSALWSSARDQPSGSDRGAHGEASHQPGPGGGFIHRTGDRGGVYAQVIPTKDRLEGLAAFKEKRLPRYKGE
ncbi:unnamed protein product, partial [Tetraodon nigroviridis]